VRGPRGLAVAYTHRTSSDTIRTTFLRTTVPLRLPSALRPSSRGGWAMLCANAMSLSLAAVLGIWAIRSDPDWFDRHVLPNYCPRATSTLVYEACARWGAALSALIAALVVRPRLATWAAGPRGPGARQMAARIAGAALWRWPCAISFFVSNRRAVGWKTTLGFPR